MTVNGSFALQMNSIMKVLTIESLVERVYVGSENLKPGPGQEYSS